LVPVSKAASTDTNKACTTRTHSGRVCVYGRPVNEADGDHSWWCSAKAMHALKSGARVRGMVNKSESEEEADAGSDAGSDAKSKSKSELKTKATSIPGRVVADWVGVGTDAAVYAARVAAGGVTKRVYQGRVEIGCSATTHADAAVGDTWLETRADVVVTLTSVAGTGTGRVWWYGVRDRAPHETLYDTRAYESRASTRFAAALVAEPGVSFVRLLRYTSIEGLGTAATARVECDDYGPLTAVTGATDLTRQALVLRVAVVGLANTGPVESVLTGSALSVLLWTGELGSGMALKFTDKNHAHDPSRSVVLPFSVRACTDALAPDRDSVTYELLLVPDLTQPRSWEPHLTKGAVPPVLVAVLRGRNAHTTDGALEAVHATRRGTGRPPAVGVLQAMVVEVSNPRALGGPRLRVRPDGIETRPDAHGSVTPVASELVVEEGAWHARPVGARGVGRVVVAEDLQAYVERTDVVAAAAGLYAKHATNGSGFGFDASLRYDAAMQAWAATAASATPARLVTEADLGQRPADVEVRAKLGTDHVVVTDVDRDARGAAGPRVWLVEGVQGQDGPRASLRLLATKAYGNAAYAPALASVKAYRAVLATATKGLEDSTAAVHAATTACKGAHGEDPRDSEEHELALAKATATRIVAFVALGKARDELEGAVSVLDALPEHAHAHRAESDVVAHKQDVVAKDSGLAAARVAVGTAVRQYEGMTNEANHSCVQDAHTKLEIAETLAVQAAAGLAEAESNLGLARGAFAAQSYIEFTATATATEADPGPLGGVRTHAWLSPRSFGYGDEADTGCLTTADNDAWHQVKHNVYEFDVSQPRTREATLVMAFEVGGAYVHTAAVELRSCGIVRANGGPWTYEATWRVVNACVTSKRDLWDVGEFIGPVCADDVPVTGKALGFLRQASITEAPTLRVDRHRGAELRPDMVYGVCGAQRWGQRPALKSPRDSYVTKVGVATHGVVAVLTDDAVGADARFVRIRAGDGVRVPEVEILSVDPSTGIWYEADHDSDGTSCVTMSSLSVSGLRLGRLIVT
jgi:hypothetical protein